MRTNYSVQGMGCAACVARVQNVLKAQKGVLEANVSLASNTAIVDYDSTQVTSTQLISAVKEAGYELIELTDEDEDDSKIERLRTKNYNRLKLSSIFALCLSVLMMIISHQFKDFSYKGLVLMILATPVVFICGFRFISNAIKQLKHKTASMDSLVALSITISYFFSLFNLLFPEVWTSRGLQPHLYFESSAMIVTFILLGRVLEEKAKRGTTEAVRKLMNLQPKIKDLFRGDFVEVKPGERIPADGVVVEGESYVDESMLTGEPIAALKTKGDNVFSGTINQKGFFRFRVEKVGKDTMLSSIIKMVKEAQGSKAKIQNLVDKVAAIFVPVIIGLSILTLLSWLIFAPVDGLTKGLLSMVTVLVIACPCSLGLATPTAIIAGIGKGASNGILIKDADSLQIASKIDVLVLDKTGTITVGHPEVIDSFWVDKSYEPILKSLEHKSEHPLAEAIIKSMDDIVEVETEHFEAILGKGVMGDYKGKKYYVTNKPPQTVMEHLLLAHKGRLEDANLAEDEHRMMHDLHSKIKEWEYQGCTTIYFHDSSALIAAVAIMDSIKEDAEETVSVLQSKGVEVYMLTGDKQRSASIVAAKVGIENYKAEMLPADKALFISELQNQGHIVAMAGDGINDSAALAKSDLSIAMGKGSDIAIDTAMVTLVSSDLNKVISLIDLSRKTVKIIKENLFWAFIYNLLAVPIAAGILYPINGFLLNPMIAAACMALSSICVVTNSLRLRR